MLMGESSACMGNNTMFYEITPEEAVGYMDWHLHALKRKGVEIRSILDIGAAHGHFSRFALTVWPGAEITAIECNPLDKHYLDRTNWDVHYVCLGDKPCTRTFYTNPNDPVGGGSSIYRENTSAFDAPVETPVEIQTLDSLNLGAFDLIKMDTQGSELDIIHGGKETIQKARYLLMELSFMPYNAGGCLIDDVLAETRAIGFRMIDTFGPTNGGHVWNNEKIQVDVLFAKETEPIFAFHG